MRSAPEGLGPLRLRSRPHPARRPCNESPPSPCTGLQRADGLGLGPGAAARARVGPAEEGLGGAGHDAGAAGPGPDGRRGLGDRRDRAVQHLRDADQGQRRRRRDAAAGGELEHLARRQDLHLQAAQGRQVPERRALQRRQRQVLAGARDRQGQRQQGQGGVRQHRRHRHARRAHGGADAEEQQSRPAVPAGPGHGDHGRAEERGQQQHPAGGHRARTSWRPGTAARRSRWCAGTATATSAT